MNILETQKKGKNTVFLYQNQPFDSKEEVYFYWWLKELENEKIISSITRSESFILADSVVESSFKLFEKIEYTPDFTFKIEKESQWFQRIGALDTSPLSREKKKLIYNSSGICHIEVKADFDNRDKTREVQIKRKWLHQITGVYVDLVKIPKLFHQTFFPKRYLYTDKTEKARKIKGLDAGFIQLEGEYVKIVNDNFWELVKESVK